GGLNSLLSCDPVWKRNETSMQALKSPHGAFVKAKANRVFAIVLVVQLAYLSFLVPAAGAQEEAPLPSGEPHFNVELIVFSYRAADSAGNEVFVPDEPTLVPDAEEELPADLADRKSTRLNSSHVKISYAVFCLKKK